MKILSIDTSSDICGVSILEDTNTLITLDEITGRTHSENLLPMIKTAFEKTSLTLSNIDLIVTNIGPGSFTGLRIGSSTAKAFSDSLNIKTIGITALESLIYNINKTGTIASILKANNNLYYFAIYKKEVDNLTILSIPCLSSKEEILETLRNLTTTNTDSSIFLIGDGIFDLKDFFESNLKSSSLNFADKNSCILNTVSLAIAGLNHFNNDDFIDILPLYLKKPQAQIELENKEKKI